MPLLLSDANTPHEMLTRLSRIVRGWAILLDPSGSIKIVQPPEALRHLPVVQLESRVTGSRASSTGRRRGVSTECVRSSTLWCEAAGFWGTRRSDPIVSRRPGWRPIQYGQLTVETMQQL